MAVPGELERGRVLVVDDEANARNAIAAMLVIEDVDGASVGRPDRVGHRAVQAGRQDPTSRSIDVHHVELGIVVGAADLVVTDVGDLASVRRDCGRAVGAFA